MAIKSKLEKSILIASMFHWGWLTIAFLCLDVFHIKDKLFALGLDTSDLNNFTLLDAQMYITTEWFKTIAPVVVSAAICGYIVAWVLAFISDLRRNNRLKGEGSFRGLTVTIGTLPEPKKLKFDNVEVKVPIKGFPEKHLRFLKDTLSLAYSKKVPAGVGHGDLTLFDHTLNVIEKAIEIKVTSPNSLCAIAAHDIGKINTFKEVDGEWVVEGKHDIEGANLIAKLDSWWELNEDDRHIIYFAVKYSHKPEQIPEILHLRESIVKCVEELRHVDHNVTGEEKEEVVEKIEEEQSLLDLFKQFLQETPLRTSNTANGQKAGGWIKHGHVFVLENYFKDNYLAEYHPEVLAAYNELGKKVRFSKITKELLKQLNEDGLLVKKWGDEKISKTAESLWVIKCGQVQFIKVIIIPLTEDIKDLVGHETYHKGLSVVSSFPRYIREQRKQNQQKGTTPKAKVNKSEPVNNQAVEHKAKNKSEKISTQEGTKNKSEESKQNSAQQSDSHPVSGKESPHQKTNRRKDNRKNKNNKPKAKQQETKNPIGYHEEMASSFLPERKIIHPPLHLEHCHSFSEYFTKYSSNQKEQPKPLSEFEIEELQSIDTPF